jgi:molybdate transport system substrate-binding protein
VRHRVARAATAITAAALLLTGCATSATGGGGSSSASAPSTGVRGRITVFAAASLTTTFTRLGHDFEAAHPGTTVTFSFAGSSDLVTQLSEGAPADVFASADEVNMQKAVKAGVTSGAPVDVATNMLAIAVPPGDPGRIRSYADLARPGVKTVVCAPQVPCGAATAKVEASSGIALSPVSQESSVTDVLGKVETGEADAGIVYATDVKTAGAKVASVPFPEAAHVVNVYPIVTIAGSAQPTTARAFVAFVAGPKGRAVLRAAGFGAP